jgi:hypothetical protein
MAIWGVRLEGWEGVEDVGKVFESKIEFCEGWGRV